MNRAVLRITLLVSLLSALACLADFPGAGAKEWSKDGFACIQVTNYSGKRLSVEMQYEKTYADGRIETVPATAILEATELSKIVEPCSLKFPKERINNVKVLKVRALN